MRRGTLVLLLFLVGVLFFLWQKKEREVQRGGPALAQYPLCPDLALERVRSVRIDHLARSVQVELERDAQGAWYVTDPIAYPAFGPLVRMLLTTVAQALGEPAPDVDLAAVALDPPQVVLLLVQAAGAGEDERTHRIEIGAIDLDPSKIYVRVPGHPEAPAGSDAAVFRTLRTLATTLDRNPDDYREPRITGLAMQSITSFRRKGQVFLEEEGRRVDLALDALATPEGWKRVDPPLVSLDPNAIQILTRACAELEAERFADDTPRSLASHGLDPPALTIELETERGETAKLIFGHFPQEDRPISELLWTCMRVGHPHVFEVSPQDVELFCRPAEFLYDYALVRAFRDDVAAVELEGLGALRVLEKDGERWSVRERAADTHGARFPADPGAVEDVLARLERTELGDYPPGATFLPEDPPLSFAVVTRDGTRWGGRIGKAFENPASGAAGRLFLRFEDELVGLIAAEIAELCARPLESFRAQRLHEVQESEVTWIELRHGERAYTFVNSGNNVWSPKGERIQAPAEFTLALDALLNLGTKRWLDERDLELVDPVAVLVHGPFGPDLAFTLGRTSAGAGVCRTESGELAEIDAELHERLLGLFE
jgi:hypothetical protein